MIFKIFHKVEETALMPTQTLFSMDLRLRLDKEKPEDNLKFLVRMEKKNRLFWQKLMSKLDRVKEVVKVLTMMPMSP